MGDGGWGVSGCCGGGVGVSEFLFTMNPNLKQKTKNTFFGGGGQWRIRWGGRGWAGVSEYFYYESEFKMEFFLLVGGGMGVGVGRA